jgi:trk system potassium uptake protein TrkA
MRVIVVGCGRVGAQTALELDQRGEHVTVIDVEQRAFQRLPANFGGVTVRGSGTDEDVLREAGAEMSDLLMALTEGDNRNALAAQMGKHIFGIPRCLAKINDPLRADAYRSLGLETICRTSILAEALVAAAVDGADTTGGAVQSPTAEPLHGAPLPGSRADLVARAALDADGPGTDDLDAATGEPSDSSSRAGSAGGGW